MQGNGEFSFNGSDAERARTGAIGVLNEALTELSSGNLSESTLKVIKIDFGVTPKDGESFANLIADLALATSNALSDLKNAQLNEVTLSNLRKLRTVGYTDGQIKGYYEKYSSKGISASAFVFMREPEKNIFLTNKFFRIGTANRIELLIQ